MVPIADAYSPGPSSSNPGSFARVGTKVFFTAYSAATGTELWVTDGTSAGTALVKDITPGVGYTSFGSMAEFKGLLYFIAKGGLWKSNGTAAGTVLVKQLGFSQPTLHSAGTLLYILSTGGGYWEPASQLWVSDGTAERTLRVRGFWSTIETPIGHDGKLFFATAEDTLLGRQLWVSDGTLFGTRLLAPGVACPAKQGGCAGGVTFLRAGSKLLFVAGGEYSYYDPDGDLWTTDGTDAGTTLVQAKVGRFLASGGPEAWLSRRQELRKTNGTVAGTLLVDTLPYGNLGPVRSKANASRLFTLVEKSYSEHELWTSDGTAAGTRSLSAKTFTTDIPAVTDTHYFFSAGSGTSAYEDVELWATDGVNPPSLVKDIVPSTGSSYPAGLFGAGSYLLFSAATADAGRELWRSDGTSNGTFLLKNIAPEVVTGEISGTVRAAGDQSPVAGATVYVVSTTGQTLTQAVTGADGTYRLEKLTTDNYYLSVTSALNVRQVYPGVDCMTCSAHLNGQQVSVTAGFTTANVDFSLTRGATFHGTVRTTAGQTLAQAIVRIQNGSGTVVAAATTTADGTFTTGPGLVAGTYYAIAYANVSGIVPVVYGGEPCPSASYYYGDCTAATTGTPLTVSLGSSTLLEFALPLAPTIRGRVIEEPSLLPIPVLQVHFYDSTTGAAVGSTYTNADGEYVSGPLLPGSYVAMANAGNRGYRSEVWHNQVCTPSCDVLGGRTISVDYDTDATGVDFGLTSTTARLRVRVTDEAGQPVGGTMILRQPNGDLNYHYVSYNQPFTEIPVQAGTYYLRVNDQIYGNPDCSSCAITTGTPIVVGSGYPTVDVDVVLRKKLTVSGRVTDSLTGLPIYYATVRWVQSSGYSTSSAQTDADGKFSLLEPAAPAYLVVTENRYYGESYNDIPYPDCDYDCAPGAGSELFDPAALTSDRVNVNFALKPRGTIKGTVRNAEGLPIKQVNVVLFDNGGVQRGYGWTDDDGRYSLLVRGTGPYFIRATDYNSAYAEQLYNGIACDYYSCNVTTGTPIHAPAGTNVTGIDFVLTRRVGGVRGTVVDDVTGKPIAGATVYLRGVSPYEYESVSTTTDAAGQYLVNLTPGRSYRVIGYKFSTEYLGRIYGGGTCTSTTNCFDTPGGTTITAQAGVLTSNVDLRLAKMTVASLAPSLGVVSGGTRVTLTGTNLPATFTLTLDAQSTQIVSSSATQIVFITPPGAIGNATLKLTSGELVLLVGNAFTYVGGGVSGDLNGDFRTDVFWRSSSGLNDAWHMDTRFPAQTRTFTTIPDSRWEVQTLGDFDGDGIADIFWRYVTTGQNGVWYTRPTSIVSPAIPSLALGWRVVGAGDFDGDGKDDIFWRNDNGGTQIWFGNGGAFRIAASTTVGLPWQPQAIGDVNGDGRDDVLWRNPSTGQNSAWLMNGTAVTARPLQTQAGSSWRMVAARDTDGDGMADIFWRNDSTGDHMLWLVNATTITVRGFSRVQVEWKPVGMGDFNGDGRADIFWIHSTTGQLSTWILQGSTISGVVPFPTRALSWKPYLAH